MCRANVKKVTNGEKRFTLELQKHPLKKVSVATRVTSNTLNTEIALTNQNIFGNSKMLMYHQLLNGVLLQKVLSKTQLNFC